MTYSSIGGKALTILRNIFPEGRGDLHDDMTCFVCGHDYADGFDPSGRCIQPDCAAVAAHKLLGDEPEPSMVDKVCALEQEEMKYWMEISGTEKESFFRNILLYGFEPWQKRGDTEIHDAYADLIEGSGEDDATSSK